MQLGMLALQIRLEGAMFMAYTEKEQLICAFVYLAYFFFSFFEDENKLNMKWIQIVFLKERI